MLKKIIGIVGLFCITTSSLFAFNQTELKLLYDKFYTRIERKLEENPQKIFSYLEQLDHWFSQFLTKSKNTKNNTIVRSLQNYNQAQIFLLRSNFSLDWNTKSQSWSKQNTPSFPTSVPPFISKLQEKGYSFVEVDSQGWYQKDGKNYKMLYTKYYELDEKNSDYFLKNFHPWANIIKFGASHRLLVDPTPQRIYTFGELEATMPLFLDMENPFYYENWQYFSYQYKTYFFFGKNITFLTEDDLKKNKIFLSSTLYIKQWDEYFFSNDFQKISLINSDIASKITNHQEFLKAVADDNKFFPRSYLSELSKIQSTTQRVISGALSDEQKIKRIYDYIVDNLSYYEDFDDGNKQIFSWIYSFTTNRWVCDGYTKLFLYMLSFAGITDVEIMKWFAFDSPDFPEFWHAWVRIGERYYDPTFDDPIWWSRNGNYLYFGIPYDLISIDRFEGIYIPESYLDMSLTKRQNLVKQNIKKIADLYPDYPLVQYKK